MIHRLRHLIGWYYGQVYTWYDDNILMIGFKCDTCGCIDGVHKSVHTEAYQRKDYFTGHKCED